MRLLLDSHVIFWLFAVSPTQPPRAIEAIVDERNEVLVSAASVWELEIKRMKGKLDDAPPDLLDRLERAGFRLLDIEPDQVIDAARLPLHHGDPFDRIIVAQAQAEAEAATLVSDDDTLDRYDVPVMRVKIWAG